MKTSFKIVLVMLSVFIFFIIHCSSVQNSISYIPVCYSELIEEEVQGFSYIIATNRMITESDGELAEENIAGTHIKLDFNKSDNANIGTEEPSNNDDEIIIRNEDGEDILVDAENEENTEDEKVTEIVNDLILYNEDEFSEGNTETNNNEILESDYNKIVYEIPSVRGQLGQVFITESPESGVVFMFVQLVPYYNQPKGEIVNDAIYLLLHSALQYSKKKDDYGQINYIAVGVELFENDMYYFLASVGDILYYLYGYITQEQFMKKIVKQHGLPNVFVDSN